MTRAPQAMAGMPRALRIFCILIALASGFACHAQAVITGHAERYDLWPQVTTLDDTGGSFSIDTVIAARDRFGPPPGKYATLGMSDAVQWLHVPLAVGPGGDGGWILDIDYALLRHVDLYEVVDGRVAAHVVLGNAEPFRSRPLRSRSHAAPITLAGGATDLYLRVDTPGARILPITLDRLPVFHMRALTEQLLQGALCFLGVFLLIFSLMQWWTLREKLYLKYVLLLVFSTLFSVHFFGIGEMYLWTDFDWPERHLAGIASLMAAACTAWFVEDALGSDLHPRLGQCLRLIAVVQMLAAAAHGLDLIDIKVVALFMSTTGLAPALLGLPGSLKKARRGDSVGPWFMVAWVGYFVASAILVGVVRGRIDATPWTLHSFQLGATFDMLVFMRITLLRSAARHREAQKAAKESDRLKALAHSDALTGLLNRRGLDDALANALVRATPERMLALYVLDLDGFKPVNDQYGHDVGDALLRVVAQRLRNSMRADDVVARLGGDEFVVMAEGMATPTQARELGNKLLDAFSSPFTFSNLSCRLSATIGFAVAPLDAGESATLMKMADAAMYAGKQQGKDRLMAAAA